MWISASLESFRPENFVIIDFYGEETCFAWQNRNLVVFPYSKLTTSTPKLPIIVAPRDIKSIRSFESRAYVICKPTGVYKLVKSLKFCILSQSGIGMGSFYYEAISVEEGSLYMKNKKTKCNRELFKIQAATDDSYNICDMTLGSGNSDGHLRRALHQLEDNSDEDMCVIANEKNVFAVTSTDVQLIYHSELKIIDIVPIFKDQTIFGFVLVGKNAAVLVYVNDDKLAFDKVYLDGEVHSLCAGISETSSDVIWIAHTDHNCIYYSMKTISKDIFQRTGMDKEKLLVIRNYKNKIIVGLSDNKQLLEIETQTAGLGVSNSGQQAEEFYNLKPEMLKGSDKIVDEICERAKELQLLNESLLEEQEKLRRINIYAHKQAIVYLPNVRVERIGGQLFLRVKFEGVLPTNCHVVAALTSGLQTIYCTKLVEDSEVVIDVPLENENLDSSLKLSIDLVTLANESQPWCLLRNYVKTPTAEKTRIQSDKKKFITAKLTALQNFMTDGNLDMKKLSSIKKSIRKELQNL